MIKLRKVSMKIIHKLNLIDYLFIVASGVILIVFLIIFFRKSDYLTVELKVTDRNVLYARGSPPTWYAGLFKNGMSKKDAFGRVTAEITDVYSYDTGPTLKAVYLTLKLKTVYSKSNNEYKYEGTTVAVGEGLRIALNKLLVEGLITRVEGMERLGKDKEVRVETVLDYSNFIYQEVEGVKKYFADAIIIGEEIKNSRGEVVARLVDKKVSPAQRYTFDDSGKIHLNNDPGFWAVRMSLWLRVKEIDGRLYFLDDNPLMISNVLPLHFNKVDLYPNIVSFEVIN